LALAARIAGQKLVPLEYGFKVGVARVAALIPASSTSCERAIKIVSVNGAVGFVGIAGIVGLSCGP
jgi:hypothetical protein